MQCLEELQFWQHRASSAAIAASQHNAVIEVLLFFKLQIKLCAGFVPPGRGRGGRAGTDVTRGGLMSLPCSCSLTGKWHVN